MNTTNIWNRCGREDIGRAIEAQGLDEYARTGRASDVVWAVTRPGVIPAAEQARLRAAFIEAAPKCHEMAFRESCHDYDAWKVAFYGAGCFGGLAVLHAEQRGVKAYSDEANAIASAAVSDGWETLAKVAAEFVGGAR